MALLCRQARGPGELSTSGWGVDVQFYVARRKRQDVDNLVKLVFDGLTGALWVDDSQVTEVHARVIHQSDNPRTEVRAYQTNDLPDYATLQCQHCGARFRVCPSHARQRKYCTPECRIEAMYRRRERTCPQCGGQFIAPQPGHKQTFCSVACVDASHRAPKGGTPGVCAHCGVATSKKSYTRCRDCYLKEKKWAGSVGINSIRSV